VWRTSISTAQTRSGSAPQRCNLAGLLSALAISDAEREQLAARYAVGQELWRVPVSHFTPWDFKRFLADFSRRRNIHGHAPINSVWRSLP